MHGMLHVVERQPLHDTRYAEAVVAVEVGDAEPGDRGRRHPGVQHLPLRALPRIEEEALGIPAQEVAVLVALSRRHLTAGAQHNQFTHGHTVLRQPSAATNVFAEMLPPHDTTATR